jgi:hypothetical protein
MSLIYAVAFVRKTCVKYKLINTYDTYLHKRREVSCKELVSRNGNILLCKMLLKVAVLEQLFQYMPYSQWP